MGGINGIGFLPFPAGNGWYRNLAIVRATTTNSGDSIKFTSANGSALSPSNSADVWLMNPASPGTWTHFLVTADVTLLLTGATPTINGNGDITGAYLRALLVNDNNASLRFAAAYVGGRTTLLTTDTTATQANVTAPEHALCDTAVGSANNSCCELGYVKADFTDAGNIWAVQTGVNAVVTGRNCDGLEQPANHNSAGFSAAPTSSLEWRQFGQVVFLNLRTAASGTSNSTAYNVIAPVKARGASEYIAAMGLYTDASVAVRGQGYIFTSGTDSTTLGLFPAAATWTASLAKGANFQMWYNAGPSASFI